MGKEIAALAPQLLWKHFFNLTQIPRPSKFEEQAVGYVRDFATEKGLAYETDAVGNILVRKPATAGKEGTPGVVLQAHLDMVPQKNTGINHDFKTDPIQTKIDGDWVTAIDTTLGADNGIGAASMLAVLDDDSLEHGPIEALFTIDEETGMSGAFGLQPDFVKGRIMLNLDSEDEGELYVGCAGGIDVTATFDLLKEAVPEGYVGYDISLTGLKGGHSGLDIKLERANANKQMARILKELIVDLDILLCDFNGGSLRNAIPREAFAKVVVPDDLVEDFNEVIDELRETLKDEFKNTEPTLKLEATSCETPESVFNVMVQDDLINALMGCLSGVYRMDIGMPGTVETSNNLSVVITEENHIQVQCLTRSSVESVKELLVSELESVFTTAGAQFATSGSYPGWKPNLESKVKEVMSKIYEDTWGKTPEVKAIHAGLECGIIGAVYPGMDIISFGPTIRFPHSPDEKVLVPTEEKFDQWLVLTLKS